MSDLFVQDALQKEGKKTSEQFLCVADKIEKVQRDIDWVFTHRKREYLPQLIELQYSKSKAVRRKIAKKLEKLAPIEYQQKLEQWKNSESDRETFLFLETLIDRIRTGSFVATETTSNQVYQVDELITIVKRKFADTEYTVEGELGAFSPNYTSSAQFFPLKGASDDALPCMALKHIIERLGFPFQEGLKLRLTGSLRLGKNARLYFQARTIQLTGEGELLRHFEQLKKKLSQEGLFDPTRKRRLSLYPKKILLLASPNSAALTDFTKVLSARRGGAEIYFLPIKTQGVGAEESIVSALRFANAIIKQHGIQTVVLTRGGGSQEELFVFNSEQIVRLLHSIHAPTIVAIGHERDTTLAELVADKRCSTPSQAAEQVSLSKNEIKNSAVSILQQLMLSVRSKTAHYQQTTMQLWSIIYRIVVSSIATIRNQTQALNHYGARMVHQVKQEIQKAILACIGSVKHTYFTIVSTLPSVSTLYQYIDIRRSTYATQLQTLTLSLEHLNPRNILQRGYTMLFDNSVVIDSKEIVEQDRMYTLQFADGTVEVMCTSDEGEGV